MEQVPIIRMQNITRTLEEEAIPVTLVRDISLNVDHGEFAAVVGPSGSGKSSLMYLLGLLDSPTSGSYAVDGVETTTASEAEKQRIRLEKIGFVFQFHFLIYEFSALENIMLPMRKRGKLSLPQMKERAEKLLEHFGLKNMGYKTPGQLSGGERQRVAIARAIANDPKILLADEPTGNLDTKNASVVFDLFERLAREEGKTILIITHDPELAKRTNRQIRIVDGKIV